MPGKAAAPQTENKRRFTTSTSILKAANKNRTAKPPVMPRRRSDMRPCPLPPTV